MSIVELKTHGGNYVEVTSVPVFKRSFWGYSNHPASKSLRGILGPRPSESDKDGMIYFTLDGESYRAQALTVRTIFVPAPNAPRYLCPSCGACGGELHRALWQAVLKCRPQSKSAYLCSRCKAKNAYPVPSELLQYETADGVIAQLSRENMKSQIEGMFTPFALHECARSSIDKGLPFRFTYRANGLGHHGRITAYRATAATEHDWGHSFTLNQIEALCPKGTMNRGNEHHSWGH
jgi:hypothetical protein